MKFDEDDLLIKKLLNTTHTPEYDIKSNLQNKIKKQGDYINFKRALPVMFIAFMMLIFSTGVAAAYIPSFNQLLSIVSPEIAVKLQPIEESSEDKGIKMDVIAATSDQEMAVIYVTMQDLTGDRIDETIDLYDSYSLTGARMFNSQMVDYNETTKTATFRIQANGGEHVDGKKVNFRIGAFLSDKQDFKELEVGVNLTEIKNNKTETIVLDMDNSRGGGGDLYEKLYEQGKINVLTADEMNMTLPGIESMYISNIGFVGNRLHVQTKWRGDNIDDHGYFYFVDSFGRQIKPFASNVSFEMDDLGETRYGRNMIEYIFDMDNLDLKKLKLMGDFVTNGKYTKGNWETTFRLQSVEEKKIDINEKFDTWTATEITISSLGVTLSGNGKSSESDELDVSIKMKDGSIQKFDSIIGYNEGEEIKMKFISDLPLDLSKVQSVIINGIETVLGV